MLTERAKLLIILFVSCLLISWFTQFELLYLISAILASILVLSFILFKLALINIKCVRSMPTAAHEDETITINVAIENISFFSNYFLHLVDNFPADITYKQEKKVLIPYLHGHSKVYWKYKGLCFKRGEYWIGPFTLIGSDPLGIFRKYKCLNVSSKLIVYPKTFHVEFLPPFMKGTVTPRYGPNTSRRAGEYEEFYGIREYHREDGLRKIHWKSTAKHNQLIVRHFEQSGVHAITIVIDLKKENNIGFGKDTTLEYAVKIAASLSKYFLNKDSIVQILTYADKPIISSFGRGTSHFYNILSLLAKVDSNCYYSLGQSLAKLNHFIPAISTLVLIRLDSDLEAAKVAEQLIFLKNISIIDIQLCASTFDKYTPIVKKYNMKAKIADIQSYTIDCGENLESIFMPV